MCPHESIQFKFKHCRPVHCVTILRTILRTKLNRHRQVPPHVTNQHSTTYKPANLQKEQPTKTGPICTNRTAEHPKQENSQPTLNPYAQTNPRITPQPTSSLCILCRAATWGDKRHNTRIQGRPHTSRMQLQKTQLIFRSTQQCFQAAEVLLQQLLAVQQLLPSTLY